MPLTHYHLKLYHNGRFLKEAEQINDRHSATILARELTQQVLDSVIDVESRLEP